MGEVDQNYARVNIRSISGPSSIQDSEESGGYANPVDALNFPAEVIQKRFSMGPATVPEERECDFSENQSNSPYQSVEDVRKMRELQNHQRQQLRQSGKNRSHSVSPNASVTNLQQHEEENQVNYYDDNPGYSRPFDALSNVSRLRVSIENLSKKPPPLTPAPAPPVVRRTTSGDRPGKERSARSLHKTSITGKESEKLPQEDNRNPVLRGGSCKKSWKVGEYNSQTNGTVTSSPPLPSSDRPKAKEQWQLPRQKQHERAEKSHLRSRSDHSFQSELLAPSKRVGGGMDNLSVENDGHPSRAETGRTASEGSAFKLKPKPPLVNLHQLKANCKKPCLTKAN